VVVKLHSALLLAALVYIIGVNTYCGVSGDPRCNGPAVTEADTDADPSELRDIGPDEEIEAYDVEESDLPARTEDLAEERAAE
jgi:hypothetical protein